MKLEDYPKVTVILRGYTYEEAITVIECLSHYSLKFAVEVTTNNSDYLKIIKQGKERFGDKIHIGVGTVLSETQAQEAIKAGAEFMLGPCMFSKEIMRLAKLHGVLTVPGAMTPSEVKQMQNLEADIIKIFPAQTVKANYFGYIQAPLGEIPLMAVGGVNKGNAKEYLASGATYVGIGSSMFPKELVKSQDKEALCKVIEMFINDLEEERMDG